MVCCVLRQSDLIRATKCRIRDFDCQAPPRAELDATPCNLRNCREVRDVALKSGTGFAIILSDDLKGTTHTRRKELLWN